MEAENKILVVRLWGVVPFVAGNVFTGAPRLVKAGDTLTVTAMPYGRTQRNVLAVHSGDKLIGYIPDCLKFTLLTSPRPYAVTAYKVGDGFCKVAIRFTPPVPPLRYIPIHT
jgi:hypothetical protein